MTYEQLRDKIRGCLMAGAAGDALGYTVEFLSHKNIISSYGEPGITNFDLCRKKARISDDTQMTLFTANGLLMGITSSAMRSISVRPEKYVAGAYIDWYYSQCEKYADTKLGTYRCTWLRNLPEMAHRRAPGITCLTACESLLHKMPVTNNSKGCGGIMRVAPMGLINASYVSKGEAGYTLQELAEAGCELASITHKHPLGFLPAGLLAVLIDKLTPLSPSEIIENIDEIVKSTIASLDVTYPEQYLDDKQYLKQLSEQALQLARSDKSDVRCIQQLGEGWTGEEAWAIALFCAVRHIDSVEDAIIASVNHDGDSDSTGSITGNIMGAIYGYEHIKARRIFCPKKLELEETLELSNIILALADDIATGCIISEHTPIDTPEKRQWLERYYEMRPSGIN